MCMIAFSVHAFCLNTFKLFGNDWLRFAYVQHFFSVQFGIICTCSDLTSNFNDICVCVMFLLYIVSMNSNGNAQQLGIHFVFAINELQQQMLGEKENKIQNHEISKCYWIFRLKNQNHAHFFESDWSVCKTVTFLANFTNLPSVFLLSVCLCEWRND